MRTNAICGQVVLSLMSPIAFSEYDEWTDS